MVVRSSLGLKVWGEFRPRGILGMGQCQGAARPEGEDIFFVPETSVWLQARSYTKFGWKKDLPDYRDRILVLPQKKTGTLPKTVDLRPKAGFPVYEQGDLGSCTANATASALQLDQLRRGGSGAQPVCPESISRSDQARSAMWSEQRNSATRAAPELRASGARAARERRASSAPAVCERHWSGAQAALERRPPLRRGTSGAQAARERRPTSTRAPPSWHLRNVRFPELKGQPLVEEHPRPRRRSRRGLHVPLAI